MTTVGILILLVQHFGAYFQNGSTDAIQHFLLIDEIMKHGWVRPVSESGVTLALMSIYPPAAHWMAAIIGWIGGSGFVGMIILTVSSIFLSYLLIARLAGVESLVRLVLLVLGFQLLAPTLALFGWEVVFNFFYPQIVGDVPYLAVLLWASYGRRDLETGIGFLLVSGLMLWLQPLNAIHLIAAGAVLLAFFSIERAVVNRRVMLREIAGIVLYLICAALIVEFNPAFAAISKIANINGGLDFGIDHIDAIVFAGLGLGAFNLLRVLRNSRNNGEIGGGEIGGGRIDAVVGSALVAATLLMIGQLLVFELHGGGSPYAVKKHFFFVMTLLLINAVRTISAFLTAIPRLRLLASLPASIVAPVVAGLATMVVLSSYTVPVAPITRALSYAESAVTTSFPGFRPGNTYVEVSSIPFFANAMITGAAFLRPQDDETFDWWLKSKPLHTPEYMMVNRTPTLDASCSEEIAANVQFVIVPRTCFGRYLPGVRIDFKLGGTSSYFTQEGWSAPEPGGEWALGPVGGNLLLKLGSVAKGPFELKVEGYAYLDGSHTHQDVTVEVNGHDVTTWSFDKNHSGGTETAAIPADLVKDQQLLIRFKTPGAVSPAQANGSSDPRILGFGVRTLTLAPSQ